MSERKARPTRVVVHGWNMRPTFQPAPQSSPEILTTASVDCGAKPSAVHTPGDRPACAPKISQTPPRSIAFVSRAFTYSMSAPNPIANQSVGRHAIVGFTFVVSSFDLRA